MNRHIFLFVRWSMEEKTMSKLFISGGTVIDPETLSRFQADVLCEDGASPPSNRRSLAHRRTRG